MSKTKKDKKAEDKLKKLGGTFNPPFALSTTWNLRRSTNRAIDLAHTQRAIQDFMDVLQPEDKYRVVWSGQEAVPGQTDFDSKTIKLSYAPIASSKDKMTPDKLVDVTMGVAIHETGHRQFKDVRNACIPQIQDIDAQILNVLEDIHIDYSTVKSRPVLGAYIRRGRDYDNAKDGIPDLIKGRLELPVPLTFKDVMGMWSGIMLYGVDVLSMLEERPFPDAKPAEEALRRLLKIGVEGINTLPNPKHYGLLARQAHGAMEEFLAEMQELMQGIQDEQNQEDQKHEDEHKDEDKKDQGKQEGDQPTPGKGGSEEEDSDDDGNAQGKDGEKDEDTEGETQDQEGEGGEKQQQENQAGPDRGGQEEEGEDSNDNQGQGSGNQTSTSSASQGSQHGGDSSSSGLGNGEQDLGQFDMSKMVSCLSGRDDSTMPFKLAKDVFEASERSQEEVGHKYGFHDFIKEIPEAGGMETQYAELGHQVRQAFETRQHMATVRYPFQESGRVSKRTLPRLFMGHTDLFEDVTQEDDLDMTLALLFDMSGSLNEEQLAIIKACISATIEGFKDDDSTDLWVWGYGYRLYRMYEPGWPEARFGGENGISAGGGTPTLPTIQELTYDISRSPSMQRKEKVIIHFTDGEANVGGEPRDVGRHVSELEENGWVVIGAGVPGYIRPERVERLLAEAYTKEHRFVIDGGFTDLPDHLREVIAQL